MRQLIFQSVILHLFLNTSILHHFKLHFFDLNVQFKKTLPTNYIAGLGVQFKKTLPTNYIAQQWGSRWPAPSETAPMGADGAAGERQPAK